MQHPPRLLTSLCAAFELLWPASLTQSTWFVDVSGTPPGTGTPFDPYTSLQYAISRPSTQSGDRIVVLPGVYAERVDYLGKTLWIESTDGAQATHIDAGGSGTAVRFSGGEAAGTRLDGFTVRGGIGSGGPSANQGGGVWCSGATVELRDCIVEACSAEEGGGIFARLSDLDLFDCTVRDIDCGGGIVALDATQLELSGCHLEQIDPETCLTSGEDYGALHAVGGEVTLVGCTFTSNHATIFEVDPLHAAGVALIDCTSSVVGCDFALHRITPAYPFNVGGPMAIVGGSASVSQCTFRDNSPEFRGGAVAIRSAQATLEDCAFEDNRSFDAYWGGALYVSPFGASDVTVRRCTFERNRGGDGGGAFIGAGQASFEECRFEDNVAHGLYFELGHGGGVFVNPGALVQMSRCVLAGNVARGNDFQQPAGGRGGGVAGPAQLEHCTLVGNEARDGFTPAEGGAVQDAFLTSSISWDNEPGELGGSASAVYSDVQGGAPGFGNIDALPRFWYPADRDFHLRASSPCIDAGDPQGPPDGDGSPPDMGAFPFDPGYCYSPQTLDPIGESAEGCEPTIEWTPGGGAAGADAIVLRATRVPNNRIGVLLLAYAADGLPFGDGRLERSAPLWRSPRLFSGGSPRGRDCSGELTLRLDREYLAARSIDPRETLQAWFCFRDPASPRAVGSTGVIQLTLCSFAATPR